MHIVSALHGGQIGGLKPTRLRTSGGFQSAVARLNNLLRMSELLRGLVNFSIDRAWPTDAPYPRSRRSEPQ